MADFTEMNCGSCGIVFHVPTHFYRQRREDGDGWYCPNGHSRVFRETDVAQLERQLKSEKQNAAYLEDRIREEERRAAAFKGQVTKLKKRASAGVCPCCNRSFQNLRRHMTTKHPGFEETPALAVVEGGKK